MAKSAFAAFGAVEGFGLFPFYTGVPGKHHLAYSVAIGNGERLVGMIYYYNTYLTSIVGVDGSRRVEKCYAGTQREATARP